MGLILGVDGGNTKTIALLAAADGTIVGAGRSGCSDIYGASSPQAALDQLAEAVLSALDGNPRDDIDEACFSLAGADWPEDSVFLQSRLEALGFGKNILIYNDALGALRAGSPDGTGVVLACGTGVAVGARNARGQFWHGSFWLESHGGLELGRQVLRAIFRSDLGLDPPTTLTSLVLDHMGKPTVESLLRQLTERDLARPDVSQMSGLAPIVLREADNGDGAACRIVAKHGASLADYAAVAARKVGIDRTVFRLVLNGGIFRHPGSTLVDAIANRINILCPGVIPHRSRYEPAVGALLLAFEIAPYAITSGVMTRLERSLPPETLFMT